MVPYSLDGVTRRKTIFKVMTVALFIAFFLKGAFAYLGISELLFGAIRKQCNCDTIIDATLNIISIIGLDFFVLTAALIASVFYIFDRRLWKIRYFSRILNIPDLNGIWIGTIDREEFPSRKMETNVPVDITIRQNFSLMSFKLRNPVKTSMSSATESVSGIIGIGGNAQTEYQLREGFNFKKDGKEIFGTTIWTLSDDDQGAMMTGEYVSGFPRTGRLCVRRVGANDTCIRGCIAETEDSGGQKYLAIQVPEKKVKRYLVRLAKLTSRDQVLELSRKRLERDGANHHLTVVSPPEYAQLTDEQKEMCKVGGVLYVITEIGRAPHKSIPYSFSYYVIVNSPHIDYIRQCAGIAEKRDLHITLGFDDEDVHGVNKGFDTSMEIEKRRKNRSIYK